MHALFPDPNRSAPRLRRLVVAGALPVVMAFTLAFDAGCQPSSQTTTPGLEDTVQVAVAQPMMDTKADSVAMRLYEAMGGHEAWAALPYLHFTFSVGQVGEPQVIYRHFWNRMTGDYRFEKPGPSGEPYVVLFNVNTREGTAYYDGLPEDSTHTATLIEEAYRRFINDSYWLLAPLKVFDEGVNRHYAADSSTATHDALHLTFGNVGLTPGDQYWLFVNKETGRLDRWTYVLQDNPAVRTFRWTAYKDLPTPSGPLHLATEKHSLAGPFAIFTSVFPTPETLPEDFFTDPADHLRALSIE